MSVSVKNAGLPSGLIGGAMAKIFDLMSIRIVKGQFTPTTAGVYNVVRVDDDSQAGSIFFAPTDCVVASFMKSTAALTGGATAQLFAGISTTAVIGASTGIAIGPTRTVADINLGTINMGTTLTTAVNEAAVAYPYLNAATASATIAGGSINVTLLVMNAKNPQ